MNEATAAAQRQTVFTTLNVCVCVCVTIVLFFIKIKSHRTCVLFFCFR